ncbi:MAG: M56 family metallopeptidase [Chitinophagaceae bacterium]|nr:M56 family metallopeptidase [Chitinophagaceae bacterium]
MQKVLPYSSAIYLVLLIIPVLQFIKNYRYVQVIRQHGISRPDAIWRVFVQKVAAQMNIKKRVQVFVSAFVHSPVTIGFLKPVILLPLAAINNLTAQQTEALLLHELTHIRRHDYLMNFAIQFIRTVLYFNPFVNAFVQIIEKERKNCDEMVLQYQYSWH